MAKQKWLTALWEFLSGIYFKGETQAMGSCLVTSKVCLR